MVKTATQMSPPEASGGRAIGRGRLRQLFAAVCAAEVVGLMVLAWMAIRS